MKRETRLHGLGHVKAEVIGEPEPGSMVSALADSQGAVREPEPRVERHFQTCVGGTQPDEERGAAGSGGGRARLGLAAPRPGQREKHGERSDEAQRWCRQE